MNPREMHDIEQAFAGLVVLAASTARYYLGLVKEGVPTEQALELALALQAQLVRVSGVGNGS